MDDPLNRDRQEGDTQSKRFSIANSPFSILRQEAQAPFSCQRMENGELAMENEMASYDD